MLTCGFVKTNSCTVPLRLTSLSLSNITPEWWANATPAMSRNETMRLVFLKCRMTKIVSLPHPQVNTFGDGVGYKGLVLRLRNPVDHPVTLFVFIALPSFRNALPNLTQK